MSRNVEECLRGGKPVKDTLKAMDEAVQKILQGG
jgi:hypothetical protein